MKDQTKLQNLYELCKQGKSSEYRKKKNKLCTIIINKGYSVSGLTENTRCVVSGSFKKCVCSQHGYHFLRAK